ncbi:MAG TPA: ABC transporter substrate binding protein [Geobacteraceae bacterium]|nr:ABC transporter substrate binding protein [Geobacteraceae bacterium]
MLSSSANAAGRYKILVVMSYHQEMPWEREIRKGIEKTLGTSCETRFYYLNAKNYFSGGRASAREAWRICRDFHPDGIIAADDDAQSLFVLPYLKDKVRTPVVFCGINSDAATYGYPASNVTGILERAHFRESISFLQQLEPGIKSFGFMTCMNSTGRGYAEQIQRESASYPMVAYSIKFVENLDEAVVVAADWKNRHDALFLIAMEGLRSHDGKPLAEKESFSIISRAFGKPVLGINEFNVREGLLCTVAKTGEEQGATAASMLLKVLGGAPVSSLPVTRNMHGKRILNISVMKSLGISPPPVFLVGTELVQTEK